MIRSWTIMIIHTYGLSDGVLKKAFPLSPPPYDRQRVLSPISLSLVAEDREAFAPISRQNSGAGD